MFLGVFRTAAAVSLQGCQYLAEIHLWLLLAVVRSSLITKTFLVSNRKFPSYLSVLWAGIAQSV